MVERRGEMRKGSFSGKMEVASRRERIEKGSSREDRDREKREKREQFEEEEEHQHLPLLVVQLPDIPTRFCQEYIIGRAKPAPHWGVQSRFFVIYNWASEASPTLGCSIEISRDIRWKNRGKKG